MSKQNIELVRSVHVPSGTDLVALLGEGGDPERFRAFASLLTPDFEAVAGDLGSGVMAMGRGLDGLLAVWRDWLAPYEAYSAEVEDFVDIDDDRVLVLNRDRARLRGSGSDIELDTGAIWTLRDGKIARIEFHVKRAGALKAAGLPE